MSSREPPWYLVWVPVRACGVEFVTVYVHALGHFALAKCIIVPHDSTCVGISASNTPHELSSTMVPDV